MSHQSAVCCGPHIKLDHLAAKAHSFRHGRDGVLRVGAGGTTVSTDERHDQTRTAARAASTEPRTGRPDRYPRVAMMRSLVDQQPKT
jgi:hypothetical protein